MFITLIQNIFSLFLVFKLSVLVVSRIFFIRLPSFFSTIKYTLSVYGSHLKILEVNWSSMNGCSDDFTILPIILPSLTGLKQFAIITSSFISCFFIVIDLWFIGSSVFVWRAQLVHDGIIEVWSSLIFSGIINNYSLS